MNVQDLKKMTKNKYKKMMTPMRKKCSCGKPVTSHHWKCDKCWGSDAKQKAIKENKEFVRKNKNNSSVFQDA